MTPNEFTARFNQLNGCLMPLAPADYTEGVIKRYLVLKEPQVAQMSDYRLILEMIRATWAYLRHEHLEVGAILCDNYCREFLCLKAKEYAFDGDRFFNFKQAAKIDPTLTPYKHCWHFGLKHLVSFTDITEDRLSTDYIAEKFGDLANYVYLLYGMLADSECV